MKLNKFPAGRAASPPRADLVQSMLEASAYDPLAGYDPTPFVILEAVDASGLPGAAPVDPGLLWNPGSGLRVSGVADGALVAASLTVTSGEVTLNLPTAEPEPDGRLWNDLGAVKVSEGAPP